MLVGLLEARPVVPFSYIWHSHTLCVCLKSTALKIPIAEVYAQVEPTQEQTAHLMPPAYPTVAVPVNEAHAHLRQDPATLHLPPHHQPKRQSKRPLPLLLPAAPHPRQPTSQET